MLSLLKRIPWLLLTLTLLAPLSARAADNAFAVDGSCHVHWPHGDLPVYVKPADGLPSAWYDSIAEATSIWSTVSLGLVRPWTQETDTPVIVVQSDGGARGYSHSYVFYDESCAIYSFYGFIELPDYSDDGLARRLTAYEIGHYLGLADDSVLLHLSVMDPAGMSEIVTVLDIASLVLEYSL